MQMDRRHDWLAGIFFVCSSVLMFTIATDFGISWDEPEHWQQGHHILAFFTSFFRDRHATNPDFLTNFYGGHAYFLSAITERLLGLDSYRTARLVLPFLGLLGVVGCWRLTRFIGGAPAGFWAAVLLLLTPSYFGHAFMNPKDMPFAVGYIWSLYFLVRMTDAYPSIPRPLAIQAGMVVGTTIGLRVMGGMLFIYLPLLLIYKQWLLSKDSIKTGSGTLLFKDMFNNLFNHLFGNMFALFLLVLSSFLSCILIWPAALLNPFQTIFRSITNATHFPISFTVFIFGEKHVSSDLPLSYLPINFGIVLPEVSLILLLAAVPVGLYRLFPVRQDRSVREMTGQAAMLAGLLVPLLFVVIMKPNIYNGIRHFLFLLPPMAALQSLLFVSAMRWLRQRGKRKLAMLSVSVVVLALFTQVARMWVVHPLEYSFYNTLIGGFRGAYNKFTLDHWLLSHKPAVDYLISAIDNDPKQVPRAGVGKPFKVFVCPFPELILPFLNPKIEATRNALEADFMILQSPYHCVIQLWVDYAQYSGIAPVKKNLHRVKVQQFGSVRTMGISTSLILSVEPKNNDEVCVASQQESIHEKIWRINAENQGICQKTVSGPKNIHQGFSSGVR
ncbi:MAG: glycosyltransferase family 39 protein [Magnetococcales bacterium]|nr:glycosyltransferase family 39 protein [Magnetococcales bacterium]